MTTPAQQRVIRWLANGETGISSKTMAFYLSFDVRPDDCGYPRDPVDFNRCLKLLAVVPEMRPHLHKMADVSPEWERLITHWYEVEASFIDEVGIGWSKARTAPKTYKLMKEIIYGTKPL